MRDKWISDPELSSRDQGPVRPLDVAYSTGPNPDQAIRLTMWESSVLYLTEAQAEEIARALWRAVDAYRFRLRSRHR